MDGTWHQCRGHVATTAWPYRWWTIASHALAGRDAPASLPSRDKTSSCNDDTLTTPSKAHRQVDGLSKNTLINGKHNIHDVKEICEDILTMR